ncbi:MAG: single-stranded DNA-binding protein [Alistipes sp.]|nr:single-stranded DNA-binding protein [Candidatus Minthomonas equi]
MNITNGTVNRIELKGHVGQEPKVAVFGDTTVIKFSMATSEIYKDRAGSIVEETTWHSISAWAGKGMPRFSDIHKGTLVRVTGRLRNNRYTDRNTGEDKSFWEVLASSIVIEDEEKEEMVNQ